MRLFIAVVRPEPFAPDRLRSFLKYLQASKQVVRFSDFPGNFYSASESLAKTGGLLRLLFNVETAPDSQRPLIVETRQDGSTYALLLDFGAVASLVDFPASPAMVDLLVAAARMLSAEYAVITAGHAFKIVPSPEADNPIALWVGAQLSRSNDAVPGMTLVQEQWDGAKLLLRTEVSR